MESLWDTEIHRDELQASNLFFLLFVFLEPNFDHKNPLITRVFYSQQNLPFHAIEVTRILTPRALSVIPKHFAMIQNNCSTPINGKQEFLEGIAAFSTI